MRWSPLARKEARTVVTSKGVWLLAVLMVLWGYRPSYIGWDGLGANITAGYVQIAGTVLLPLGVLLLTYQSIVGERTSGSVKFILGLPLTRTDILLGKVAGRTAGIAGPVAVACLVLGILGLVDHGVFNPILFLGMVLSTIVYVGVLVSIGTAVSAVAKRTVTAAGTVFGVIFLPLVLFWTQISTALFTQVTGTPVNPYEPPASGPLFLLLRLSPDGAYRVVSNWLLGVGNSANTYSHVLTKLEPQTQTNAYVVEATFAPGTAPLYLNEAVGLLILLVWAVVPLGFARYYFSRGDAV
ncbi:ABC transporter permease [Halopenitus persicus]|uniref:ABC-2 family transporter protein n=1 Tax=Halopenitus persicus TaxID=1048396 RepID=A0A1H3MWA1_9EURY|nr:ABC-2 family transporter protein [Halopenitus persicus]